MYDVMMPIRSAICALLGYATAAGALSGRQVFFCASIDRALVGTEHQPTSAVPLLDA